MSAARKKREPAAWVVCGKRPGRRSGCPEFWCTIHGEHVADCPCPPIDEWKINPYSTRGPP